MSIISTKAYYYNYVLMSHSLVHLSKVGMNMANLRMCREIDALYSSISSVNSNISEK